MRSRWVQAWTWMPALTACSLPLHPRLSVISLIIWGVMALLGWSIRIPSQNRNSKQGLNWGSIGPVLYFVGLAVGMTWTEQMEVGWFALEVKSTLVILPVLFWLQVRWSSNGKWVPRARGTHFPFELQRTCNQNKTGSMTKVDFTSKANQPTSICSVHVIPTANPTK